MSCSERQQAPKCEETRSRPSRKDATQSCGGFRSPHPPSCRARTNRTRSGSRNGESRFDVCFWEGAASRPTPPGLCGSKRPRLRCSGRGSTGSAPLALSSRRRAIAAPSLQTARTTTRAHPGNPRRGTPIELSFIQRAGTTHSGLSPGGRNARQSDARVRLIMRREESRMHRAGRRAADARVVALSCAPRPAPSPLYSKRQRVGQERLRTHLAVQTPSCQMNAGVRTLSRASVLIFPLAERNARHEAAHAHVKILTNSLLGLWTAPPYRAALAIVPGVLTTTGAMNAPADSASAL